MRAHAPKATAVSPEGAVNQPRTHRLQHQPRRPASATLKNKQNGANANGAARAIARKKTINKRGDEVNLIPPFVNTGIVVF